MASIIFRRAVQSSLHHVKSGPRFPMLSMGGMGAPTLFSPSFVTGRLHSTFVIGRDTANASPGRVIGRIGAVIKCDMTTAGHAKALKTKKAASKRMIKTGKGGLKRGRANTGHLTSKMSPVRKRKLNAKVHMQGTMLKKMNSLILTGK
jgi:ribosomal protein L35